MALRPFQEVYRSQINFHINQSAGWLNKFDRPAITPITEPYLEKASDPNLPLDEVKALIARAVALSRRFEGSLETPEVQVRGGVILFMRGDTDGSRDLLGEAASFYEAHAQFHRHAVVCLILGYLDMSVENRAIVLQRWDSARIGFEVCRRKAERDPMRAYNDPLDERPRWYADRLHELTVEEALLPEKVVGWLNRYEPISLSDSMSALRNQLYDAVAQGDAKSVRRTADLVAVLSAREDHPHTTALMLSHAGAALLMAGIPEEAARFLKDGLVLSNRRSHQGAVICWLKALAEWQLPDKRKEAVISSRRASEALMEMAAIADRRNEHERREWILSAQAALREVADRLFNLFLPDLLQ